MGKEVNLLAWCGHLGGGFLTLKNEENFNEGRHCLGEHLSLSNPRHRP